MLTLCWESNLIFLQWACRLLSITSRIQNYGYVSAGFILQHFIFHTRKTKIPVLCDDNFSFIKFQSTTSNHCNMLMGATGLSGGRKLFLEKYDAGNFQILDIWEAHNGEQFNPMLTKEIL